MYRTTKKILYIQWMILGPNLRPGIFTRSPKMAEPTRIWVAPKLIAFSKSEDIPLKDTSDHNFQISSRSAKLRFASSYTGGIHYPLIVNPYLNILNKNFCIFRRNTRFRLITGVNLTKSSAPKIGANSYAWPT